MSDVVIGKGTAGFKATDWSYKDIKTELIKKASKLL